MGYATVGPMPPVALTTGAAAAALMGSTPAQVKQPAAAMGLVQKPVAVVSEVPVEAQKVDTSAMEDSLMALLDSESGNTPELATFVASIKQLINSQMKPKIQANRDGMQATIQRSFDGIAGCAGGMHKTQASISATGGKVSELAASHKQCRQTQSTMATDSQSCQSQLTTLATVRTAACNSFSDFQSTSAATCTKNGGESYRDYAVRLQSYFTAQVAAFDQKKKACDDATSAHNAQQALCSQRANSLASQKSTCDQLQDQMDVQSCSIVSATKDMCAANDACYTSAVASYNGQVAIVKPQEAGVKTEMEAVLRLNCLADTFAAEDGGRAAAITACRNKDYSQEVAPLSINYPAVPSKTSCAVADGLVGSNAYAQANWASLPSNAAAKTCVATCCSSLSAVPGFTLIAKQDSTKCMYPTSARSNFLVNDANPGADCFMSVGKQQWGQLIGQDGKFTFKLVWKDGEGTTIAEYNWKQSTHLSSNRPSGFEPLDAVTRTDFGRGDSCTGGFKGMALSGAQDRCVLDTDGSGGEGCWWNCVGEIGGMYEGGGNRPSNRPVPWGVPGPRNWVVASSALFVANPAPNKLVLLARQDTEKCMFDASASRTYLMNSNNPSADCFMNVGSQDWNSLKGSDGKLTFKLQWHQFGGSVVEYNWRQSSLLTQTAPVGFEALDAETKADSANGCQSCGPGFCGMALSDSPSRCVMDGNGHEGCWWNCVGEIGGAYEGGGNRPAGVGAPWGIPGFRHIVVTGFSFFVVKP